MAGYTRQSTFADGDTITAALFNNEYNQLLNAFSNTGGHKHDGTANEGPVIGLIGDAGETAPNNKVLIDTTNNYIEFYVEVSSAPVQQLYIADGAIIPVTDSDVDLGTTSLRFKDTYTDTITTTGNATIGGDLTVTGSATISGNLTFGDADTDSINLAAEIDSDIIPNTDGTYDLGSATKEWQDLYIDGTANIDSLVADTADIDGGTIDGATIATSDVTVGAGKTLDVSAGTLTLADDQISGDKVEGGTIAATTITTLTSTTGNITTVNSTTTNATTVDSTNLEVTNLKAKDGTAAGSIANSTGVVTLGSSVLTTTDINGGTIDGATIGGTTAGAVTFTDLSDGTITIAGFADEDNMISNSATLLPTQQSVKAYVDSQVTAQDLDFQGDTGGALSIDLDSESLTIAGGTGLDTVGSGNTVTVNIDSTVATLTGTQTLTNKTLTSPVINTGVSGTAFLDDDTFATATATTLASSESIKAYVDTTVAATNEVVEDTTPQLGGDLDLNSSDITGTGNINITGTATTDGLTVDSTSAVTAYFNRKTSDGSVLEFQKDNTTVGSIGVVTGDNLFIQGNSSHNGLAFGSNALIPFKNSAYTDDVCDIGGSSNRFKDLYLSGTGYFGTSVGIGTTSPSEALNVIGNIVVNNSYGFKVGGGTENGTAVGSIVNTLGVFTVKSEGARHIRFDTNSEERMRIDSSGNVGIGTTSPDALMHLSANTGATLRLESTDTNISANEVIGVIEWEGNDATTGSSGIAGKIDLIAEDATPEYAMRFFTHDNLSGTAELAERMRIDSSGLVGIGTNSPSTKLEVAGDVKLGAVNPMQTATNIVHGTSGEDGFLVRTAVSAATSPTYSNIDDNNTGMFFAAADTLGFATGASERIRIDSSGNLLVGKTATGGNTAGMQIIAGSFFSHVRDGGVVQVLNRKTSDGDILQFEKDNEPVGSIGSEGGDALYIQSGTTSGSGLHFHPDNAHVLPAQNGITVDDTIDLGRDSKRFKDLYLSGKTYLNTSSGAQLVLQTDATRGFIGTSTSHDLILETGGSERMRIDSSGNLLVGTTSAYGSSGVTLDNDGVVYSKRSGGIGLYVDRETSDGALAEFRKDGSSVGNINVEGGELAIGRTTAGLQFLGSEARIRPFNISTNAATDNTIDLGRSNTRFNDIYATNGTIQTSDRNEKQDIAELTDAETRVAVAAKGLLRKFRWKDAVAEKGDEARTHFGIIAQDLQDAFTAEGLDAGDYAMFISDTWTDDDGVEQTRLGVRYSELLAFIIAAI